MGMILRRSALAVVLILLLVPVLQAQETRTVDGRTYIVHTVEAGQTLYAISRSYAVPVDALLEANPGSAEGLSIGQELLVPRDAVLKKEARTAPILLRDGELQHTVAKRETLFGIARNYGVDINALLERNPELNAGLREGMVVVVPMANVVGQKESVVRPAVAEEWVEHVVLPGETLFGLGQRYGVAPERIRSANDGLPEGLKAGQVLRIPVEAGNVPIPSEVLPPMRVGGTYKIALLLPFSVERNDSVLAAKPGRETRFHEATRIAAQFNAGAMLAFDSLKVLGLDAQVLVVDMGEEPRTWNAVLKRADLKDVDLFIGPFHRSAIEQLARSHPSAHIVCPVPQSNKVILGQPTVSKVTATRVDLIRHTARYVAQRHRGDNIIMLKPDIHADREAVDQMHRALNAAWSEQAGRSGDSVKVVPTGRRDVGKLTSSLKSDRLNVVVVPSEDVEFVTNLVAILRPMASKQQIAVVGLESWAAIETVSPLDLETLGFMFATATFFDVEDPGTQAFVQRFRERYKNDVDEYAMLGYDVTLFYGKALLGHGRNFPAKLPTLNERALHMDLRMSRTGPENGYRNEGAIMLKQQDLKLVRLR
jgi:LysM repeat protein/ABC-type branched-subunit amino acid transport system substrate-binding protein